MKPLMTLLGLAALAVVIWLGYRYWRGPAKNSPHPENPSASEIRASAPGTNPISPMDQTNVTAELPGEDAATLIKSETPPSAPGADSPPAVPKLDPLEEIGKPIEEAQATPTPSENDDAAAYDRAEEARRIAARQLNYKEEPGEDVEKPPPE